MKTDNKGKLAVGISTADRINAEIRHRQAKIAECEDVKEQMQDEIAKLTTAREVVVGA